MTDWQKSAAAETMAKCLPALRKCIDITQKDFAEAVGISRSTLANIENGRQSITWPVFLSMVFVFAGNESSRGLMKAIGISPDLFDNPVRTSLDYFAGKHRGGQGLRGGMNRSEVIAGLSDDFVCVFYVEISADKLNDVSAVYRIKENFLSRYPNLQSEKSFHNILDIIADNYVCSDDRADFIASTRRERIVAGIKDRKPYYVNFRGILDDESVESQIKFAADLDKNGNLKGFVAGIHRIDEESGAMRTEKRDRDIINVLSYKYNAVYYCDADTHSYDILFQQGFVKEELKKLKEAFPKFEGAFGYYVQMLVHPDDRSMMNLELSRVEERLRNQKSFKREFLRSYGGRFLYTEMNCVKIGEADDPLHYFVVGFAENDSEYRGLIDRQKQLEYMVTDRTAELRMKNSTLNRINEDIIALLGNLTEARDLESGEHVRRVRGFSRILAQRVMEDWPEYGLNPEMIELITSASALHDIGKIMIPDSILRKPDRLTRDEFEIMKTHCDMGCRILRNAPPDWSESYRRVAYDICRYHHERYDGNGYPLGLAGDSIPVSAQIVSVADCFDALTTKRVYKEAYGLDTAFDMILNGECGVFSGKILSSLRACREPMFRYAEDTSSRAVSAMSVGLGSGSLSGMRIMVVDDDDRSRELDAEILEGEGAEVISATGGEEAVKLFAAAPHGRFSAVLTDIVMPGMSGPETAAALRALEHPDAKSVPIIGLMSLATDEMIQRCTDSGMTSYVTKPIAATSLARVLYRSMKSPTEALEKFVSGIDETASARMERLIRITPAFSGRPADYDMLVYVSGATDDILGFRASAPIEKVLDGINPRFPSNRRLDELFRRIVPQIRFREFLTNVDRSSVIESLKENPVYETSFNAVVGGAEGRYSLQITRDTDEEECFLFAVKKL